MNENVDHKMTEQDYQLLSQYIDGELPSPEAQALRKRLIADPLLRAELERMQRANERVVNALRDADRGAVPAHVVELLERDSAGVAQLSTVRRAGWGLAIAATVLAASGILLNPQWSAKAPDRDTLLAGVLEQHSSSASDWHTLEDGQRARAVLSFRSVSGSWCREYLVAGEGGDLHGIACREDGAWRTRVITEIALAEPDSTEYVPAAAADSDRIARFIDANAADIAVSRSEEKRLIENDWQPLPQ